MRRRHRCNTCRPRWAAVSKHRPRAGPSDAGRIRQGGADRPRRPATERGGQGSADRGRGDPGQLARPHDDDGTGRAADGAAAGRSLRDRPARREWRDHGRGGRRCRGGAGARAGAAARAPSTGPRRRASGGAGHPQRRAGAAGGDDGRAAALLRAGVRARAVHDRARLPLGGRGPGASPAGARSARCRCCDSARASATAARSSTWSPSSLAGRRWRSTTPSCTPICGVWSAAWRRCSPISRRRSPWSTAAGGRCSPTRPPRTCLGSPHPAELTHALPGTHHAPLHRLDEQGRELDLESMPATEAVRGEQTEPLLVRNIVRATRRGALADRPRLADPGPGDWTHRLRGQRLREHHRGQACAARRELHGGGQPGACVFDGLRGDAAARSTAGRAADSPIGAGSISSTSTGRSNGWPCTTPIRASSSWSPVSTAPTARRSTSRRGVPEVIRTGEARIFTDIQPEALAAYAHDSEHLELLSAIGATAVIIVPMIGATGRAWRDHAGVLGVDAPTHRRRPRARRAARPPRGHRRGKRAAVHRAHPHRPHPPAGAAAGGRCPRCPAPRSRPRTARRAS